MIPIRLSVLAAVLLLGLTFLDLTEGRYRRKSYSQNQHLDNYEESYPAQDYRDSDYERKASGYEYRGHYGSKPRKSKSGSRKHRKGHRHHKSQSKEQKTPQGRFIGSIVSKVTGLLGSGKDKLTNLFSNIMSGSGLGSLFSGVKNTLSSIYSKLTGAGGAAVEKVKGMFGILSDSGFDADSPAVKDKASELLSSATGFLSGLFAGSDDEQDETETDESTTEGAADGDDATTEAPADEEETTTEAAE